MKKELTCICCPIGCRLSVILDGKQIESISGNTCKRGEEYAKSECTNPLRTVTSTVMTAKGIPLPVNTDRAIPKDKIFECMKIINSTVVNTPVKIGEILVKDVFGSNIVATANIK